jgi:hypothetical protein
MRKIKQLKYIHLIGTLAIVIVAFYFANNNSYVKIIQKQTPLVVLDMHLNNNVQYVYRFLHALGEIGREAYHNFIIRIDFIFPVIYSSSFFLILLFLKQRIKRKKVWNGFVFFPFVCGLSDWIENSFILQVLKEYPHVQNGTSMALNIAVWSKAISGLLIFIIFLYFIGLLISDWVARDNN